MLPKLQEKVQCVRGERKLNFGNEIIEILVLPILTEMETNCSNGIAENGREKKKELWQLSCRKLRKKNPMCTTFFITNYRWLVIIGSNLNLTLRLLICSNNNNQ